MEIINIKQLLDPNYKPTFKEIPPRVWELLQKDAEQKLLEERAAPEVEAHWRAICAGELPFGLKLFKYQTDHETQE